MVSYDLVSMAAILRDFERPKYLDKEHQLLTDIADSLYNVGVNPSDFGAEYKDLYNQYGKSYWDKVIADMRAIDSQITSDRGARELAADYYDRVGDADFYEDYYGSYEGSSDGYGVYSYRNGQEDSYTYAKDYDEALKYAKWDLTHKNYIDVVRIIDNATGEVVGEFDSLDSIGESYKKESKDTSKGATDFVNWMYREFPEVEFIREQSTKDKNIRLVFDISKLRSDVTDLFPDFADWVDEIRYRSAGYFIDGNTLYVDCYDDEVYESYKREANRNHYPKYVTRDGYIGTFKRVDPGVDGEEIPIYRFPGGESMVDDYELDNGYDEGCSPRKKKSSEKKIINQGCGSKRSSKKESRGYRSYTQRQIKDYVKDGLAIDVTNYGFDQMKDLLHSIDKEIVGISRGTYGVNGVLFKDAATGQFYAVCARNTASQMVI